MLIKNYQAETVSKALRMAREELGPNAVVLKTTPVPPVGRLRRMDRKMFQVTACIDDGILPGRVTGRQPSTPSKSISSELSIAALHGTISDLQRDVRYLMVLGRAFGAGQRVSTEMIPYYLHLTTQEIDPALAENVIAGLEKQGLKPCDREGIRNAMLSAIGDKLPECSEISLFAGRSTRVAFVGPPGSGKSALVAKLASRYATERNARVTLVSVDDFKPTAARELQAYGDILKVPYMRGDSIVTERGESGVVLIDTAGVPINAVGDLNLLKAELSRLEPDEIHLVLPAYCRWDDMRKWYDFFRPVGVARVAMTFMDQASVHGAAINLAVLMNVSFSYFSRGRTSAADLEPADLYGLARRLAGTPGGEL